MLIEIADVFAQPESYVCIWRDGELYVRAVANLPVPTTGTEQTLAL
jgi:hypothetical protein